MAPLFKEVPADLKAACKAAVEADVARAYDCLVAPLQSMIATVSAEDYVDHAGVQALPNGAAYYAYKLREQTSTQLSPEEVHNLGHSEVKRIMDEMATTIAKLAAAGDSDLNAADSVPTNMQRLAKNPSGCTRRPPRRRPRPRRLPCPHPQDGRPLGFPV